TSRCATGRCRGCRARSRASRRSARSARTRRTASAGRRRARSRRSRPPRGSAPASPASPYRPMLTVHGLDALRATASVRASRSAGARGRPCGRASDARARSARDRPRLRRRGDDAREAAARQLAARGAGSRSGGARRDRRGSRGRLRGPRARVRRARRRRRERSRAVGARARAGGRRRGGRAPRASRLPGRVPRRRQGARASARIARPDHAERARPDERARGARRARARQSRPRGLALVADARHPARPPRLADRDALLLPLPRGRERDARAAGSVHGVPAPCAAPVPSPSQPRRRPARRRAARVMLSVVAPAYNEADALPAFLSRLLDVLEEVGGDWELVLVDDGSRDGTWQEIERAARDEPRIRGIRLSRNFGHQLALTAGMSVARGDAVITLDSDLQHPPEAIPALLGAARKGYDVVYAVRSPQDAAGWWKRFTARVFYAMLNRLSSLELPEGAADYRLMSRRVVDVLVEMPERHRFLRGLTRWAGFGQAFIEYHRGRRETGETKYTLRRMVLFAWDAVVSFSSFPLRVASVVGACV